MLMRSLVVFASMVALPSLVWAGSRELCHPPISSSPVLRIVSPFAKRQTQCITQCNDDSDLAILTSVASCPSTDLGCLCEFIFQLSPACLQCVLTEDDLDETSVQEICAGESTGTSSIDTTATKPLVPPTGSTSVPTSTPLPLSSLSAAPTATTTGGIGAGSGASNFTQCDSECSDDADAAAAKDINGCSSTDLTCLCNALSKLSRPCFDCMIAQVGITESQYAGLCAAETTSVAPSLTPAVASTLTTPSGTASGAASPTSSTHSAANRVCRSPTLTLLLLVCCMLLGRIIL